MAGPVDMNELISTLEFMDVECMGMLPGPDGSLRVLLEDDDGIRVEVPSSQFTDNGLRLPECGAAEIPVILHKYWFGRRIERMRAEISDNIHAHFHGLMSRKHTILDDPELYMAQPDWLCLDSRYDRKGYAIGSLLEGWGKGTMLKADDGESFIIRIMQKEPGAERIYEAWHPEKGLVVGYAIHNAWLKAHYLDDLRDG